MKNSVETIRKKQASFTNNFCNEKYKSHSKCYSFYMKNIEKDIEGIVKCPYGYTCFFWKNIILSSIIDEKNCNLAMIKGRQNYNRKMYNKNDTIHVLSDEEFCKMIEKEKFIHELEKYSDTFHDLNNNNRYLRDTIEKLKENDKIDEVVLSKINDIFSIFEQHKSKILECIDQNEKLKLYVKEIDNIKSLITELRNDEYVRKNMELKSNLDFIDYRIRYLDRITKSEADFHKYTNLKELNLYKILFKLKNTFNSTLIKKEQKIIIETDENYVENDFYINAYDDIYLGFFILLENAIKYAPLGSSIEVFLSKRDGVYIEIKNKSSHIDNTKLLTKRGVQGDNHKEGSGLGLSIAMNIFNASNFTLNIEYENEYFLNCLRYDEIIVAAK